MVFVVAIVQHLVYILITVSSASTAVTVLRSYAIILQDVQDSKVQYVFVIFYTMLFMNILNVFYVEMIINKCKTTCKSNSQ